jgi:ABC-type transport system substrate-binding protein
MEGGFGVTADLLAPDPYDPDLAKSLLAEINYPAAFTNPTIHIMGTAGPGMDLLFAIQGYWDDVGIDVAVETLESTVWMGYVFIGRFTGTEANIGWVWSWPGAAFDSTYMQKNLLTSYGVHGGINDPVIDAMWDKYIVETDPDKSRQYFTEFLTAGFATYTSIGLFTQDPKIIISDDLGAFTTNTHLYYSDAYAGIKHP